MAESIREKIIQAFVARAGEIMIANGYGTDVGVSVVRATRYADPGTMQQIVIIPRVETSEKTRFQKMTNTFPIDLHAFVAMTPGTDNASEKSEEVYADLIKAITNPCDPACALFDSVTHTGGGGVELVDNEATLAGATATFTVVYTTSIGNPFYDPTVPVDFELLIDSTNSILIDGSTHNLLI